MSTQIVAYIARPDVMTATTVIMEIIRTSHGKDKICLEMGVCEAPPRWLQGSVHDRRRSGIRYDEIMPNDITMCLLSLMSIMIYIIPIYIYRSVVSCARLTTRP